MRRLSSKISTFACLTVLRLAPFALHAGVVPEFPSDVAADQWLRKQSTAYRGMAELVDQKWGYEFGRNINSTGGLAYLKDGKGHIDLNASLRGAQRVSVIIFELTNLYQQERHEEITTQVRSGALQDVTRFAMLREAVEYDGLRLHREVLLELERQLGELPAEMITWASSTATNLSSYLLPFASDYFKAQAASGHTDHFRRLFATHVAEAKAGHVPPVGEASKTNALGAGLVFIDTSFENASPLWYERDAEGTILINLLYDHERASPNRAAGHFHFQVQAAPGARLTLEFKNLDNVWNGKLGSVAKELKTVVVSEDGRAWKTLPTESLATNRVRLALEMPGPRLFVARLEPYRLSDLDRLLAAIRKNPRVKITTIGQTVQGRELEIVRIGNPQAPHRVFVRARAHPWEAGGSWVVEGLVHRLLQDDAQKLLKSYCVYLLPMANKDGVACGRTRFNLQGKDLNRNWDKPADPLLAPENAALEKWLEGMLRAGQPPQLAMELHNDGSGLLHISRPPVAGLERHLERMALLETLLRKHTWFTEGSTKPAFHNAGSLGDGWLLRYGIDAVIQEFNCNWIAGLKDYPSARHWQAYGEKLADVFNAYFEQAKP